MVISLQRRRRWLDFLRNFFAVIGFLALVGGAIGVVLIVKSSDLPPRVIAEKVLKKTGLESKVLSDWVKVDPVPHRLEFLNTIPRFVSFSILITTQLKVVIE